MLSMLTYKVLINTLDVLVILINNLFNLYKLNIITLRCGPLKLQHQQVPVKAKLQIMKLIKPLIYF
jgi:hypothetical protein